MAPSILAQLNIKIPSSFKGVNIFNINDTIGKEFGFSQFKKWVLIRDRGYIFKKSGKHCLLYDLASDPFELTDISEDNIRRVENFMGAYSSFISNKKEIETEYREIDKETIRQLESLGYLG